jgi:GAF domain-containing protein
MIQKQSQFGTYKRPPTLEQLRAKELASRRELAAIRSEALEMKEQALDMRLRIWLNRIADRRAHSSRANVLECVLDAAMSVASADFANIQLVGANRRRLTITAQRGFHSPFLHFFEIVDAQDTACGVALAERRSIAVLDITSSAIFADTEGLDVLLDEGIRAVVSEPLIDYSNQLVGVLSVHYRLPQTNTELPRLRALAAAVAESIN